MPRKGISTLTGLSNGGGGGGSVPVPNPPVPPVTPPATQQTINMGFVSAVPTVFAPTISQIGGGPITRTIQLPLVVNTSLALGPSVSIAGSFTETFQGTNGANWDTAKWHNKRTTTNAIGDLIDNTGRLASGTNNNYNGVAGYMTRNAYANFEMTGSFKVQGTTTYVFPHIGFRSSGSWAAVHGSALNSYWLEFNSGAPGLFLFKRVNDTPTLVASTTAFTWTVADTVRWTINCSGTSMSIRAWKNAEAVPTGWQMQVIDPTAPAHTSGYMYLSLTGGGDAVPDEVRWGPLTIQGSVTTSPPVVIPPVEPPVIPPVTGQSLTRIGATWTGVRPTAVMNSVIGGAHDTQAVHIIDFGPAGGNLNPSPGVYNWGPLDASVAQIMAAGPSKPIIIFCRCPPWMRSQPPPPAGTDAFYKWEDNAPIDSMVGHWAELCKQVAARYTQVQYFSYWNEMKGYYNVVENHYDWVRYTQAYNAVWNAVKSIRPTAKIGGPYVILESHADTSVSALKFPGGAMDPRVLQTMLYFKANAVGFDFLSCDGGMENQFGAKLVGDPHQQVQKLWGWWVWVRQNIHPTCELFNFETYCQYPWYSTASGGLGWSTAQIEDLWMTLVTKTRDNVPNPNVTYLTWFHPQFVPQVVDRVNDFAWTNTKQTSFYDKVVAFHGSQPPPVIPPTPTGTIRQVPAQGTLQQVCDIAQPGDTIYVSGVNTTGGKVLHLNNRRNGALGENPITIIGNPGNVLRGGQSGIEGYGSNRGWHFFNLNIEVDANSYYGECFYFAGERSDQGGDGQGCTNIRIVGCTGRPIAGTGQNVGRHGAAVWGGGSVEIGNCDFAHCGWNDNGFPGGAASGISIGRSIKSNAPLLPNGYRVWVHGNKVRDIYGPGTGSYDRNALIMDIYHGWEGNNQFWSNREVGGTLIEGNDFANCEGRGIQLLCCGAGDSPVLIRNNLIRPYMATNLAGSAPDAGIGGYGVGICGAVTCTNNDVQVSAGHQAYYFISFNAYGGVTGSGNIGNPRTWDGSPGNSPPAGF